MTIAPKLPLQPIGETVFSRASLAFAARSFWKIFANAGDLSPTDILIALAVWNSNSRHLNANMATLHAICFRGIFVPEAAKRPVSRNAISRFLNLPFETSRRRIETLLRKGILAEAGGGLVCTESCDGYISGFGADVPRTAETLAWMYGRLANSGIALPHASWMGPGGDGVIVHEEWTKAVSMFSVELMLLYLSEAFRTLDHGILPILVILSVAHRSEAHLLDPGAHRWALDGSGASAATTRKQIAQLLNRPTETVRRVTSDLISSGFIVEREDGLVASDTISNQLQTPTFVRHNRIAAMRVFASLQNLSDYHTGLKYQRLAS